MQDKAGQVWKWRRHVWHAFVKVCFWGTLRFSNLFWRWTWVWLKTNLCNFFQQALVVSLILDVSAMENIVDHF